MKIKTTDLPEPIGYCSVSNAHKNAKGVPEGKKITDRSFPAGAPLETSGSYFSLQPPDADSLTGKKPVLSSFPVRLTPKQANPSQKGLIHIQQI